MDPKRLLKPALAWTQRRLVPVSTPFPFAKEGLLQVSARVLFPKIYNAQQYQPFQRWTKVSPPLNLKQVVSLLETSGGTCFGDTNGSYLFVNFTNLELGSYESTAVVFSDGALVTWYMPKSVEDTLAVKLTELGSASNCLGSCEAEVLPVFAEPVETGCVLGGDIIGLTLNDSARSDEMLTVSMALASSVRMNALENSLAGYIEDGHSDLLKLLKTINNWKLSNISESVFLSEKGVHNWRYYLSNTTGGTTHVPEILWEYESLDKLFHAVSNNCFDVNKRFVELQNRLTHYHEFLLTVGEYIRHRYSSRLEKIIILIIAIEAILAFRHAVVDLLH